MPTNKIAACGALLLLAACASAPTGPSVMVLPGSSKSFEQFRFDDYECRQYASEYSGGKTAEQASADAGIKSAAAGAAIGALAGAAIGGNGNAAAAGAGLGAAGGAIAGTGAGDDLVGRGGENAGDHLVIARILVRRLALPGLHSVGEGLQVAPADTLEPGLRLGALLGDIGELRHLHLLGARLVARLGPCLAVHPDELPQLTRLPGVRHDHQVKAVARRVDERLLGRDGGDPDRRMRLLHDPRHEVDVLEIPVLALGRDSLLAPQASNHADRLLEALPALRHRHAIDLELLRQESAAEAGVQATLAQVIEHRELAAEVRRMVKRRDHRAGDEADALGARRHRRQEHAGIRRMPAIVVERVLDRLNRAVAENVGALGDAQALLIVVCRGAVLRAEGGEKVKSELHRGWPPATRRA